MKNDRLLVYDASAGSGKTFNLAEQFSDYLIEEYRKGKRDVHRYVMAVTFTNKATFEMKSRIISRLFERSRDTSYQFRKEAKDILQNLVHDYTMFKVSTIDSFFQKVLKAFALEMGSSSSYDTSLDSQSALEAAMDSVYSKLGSDGKLLSIMEKISLSRLKEGKYWNWRDELLKICSNVLSPDYQNFKPSSESISLSELAGRLTARNKELEKAFVLEVKALDDELTRSASASDLDCLNLNRYFKDFLKGKLAKDKLFLDRSRNKIINHYPDWIDRWLETPESLLLKKGTSADLEAVKRIDQGRMEAIKNLYDKYYGEYLTLSVINRYIRETALLDYVSKELDDYLSSHQLTLLSSAPKILSDLIDGSDTPFVYDKIGASIDHYLLDEFQDTSIDQWNNFRPLLKESIATDNQSLLVGDVKQSIYRWRGGDWSLLKDVVPQEFRDYYSRHLLNTNYRSLSNIVEFNNLMFSSDPHGFLVKCYMDNLWEKTKDPLLSKEIAEIYSDSAQHVRPEYENIDQKGVVHVIDCSKLSKDSGMSKTDFILWDVARRIEGLVSSDLGYMLGDIAILTSSVKEAGLIANYLVDKGISIISGESLLIESNKVISVLLEILKKISNPADNGLEVMTRITGVKISNPEFLSESSEEGKAFYERIKSCSSLYQICKVVLKTFFTDIDKGDIAFVKAFLDKVLDYSVTEGTSITSFLKWWSSSSGKFFIPEPDGGKAVRIMTMHKAKGLDFKVVFIPFLRDEMISTIVSNKWLRTDKLGYDGPLLLPMSSKLEKSFYEKELNRERMELSVDSLNLAYVSFTRPKERLYIYAPKALGKDGKISTISAALNLYCSTNCSEGKLFRAKEETLENGECAITDYLIGDDNEVSYACLNGETSPEYDVSVDIDPVSILMQEPSKARLKSGYEDDDIVRGVLYHELFSYIDEEGNTEGNIEVKVGKAVDKFLRKNPGSLLGDNSERLVKEILAKIYKVSDYGWFDCRNKVLGEKSIISSGGTYRPDRIILPSEGLEWVKVVDFKFGRNSINNSSYHRQVRKYMKLLSQMGYKDVRGYLWHVLDDVVEQVE